MKHVFLSLMLVSFSLSTFANTPNQTGTETVLVCWVNEGEGIMVLPIDPIAPDKMQSSLPTITVKGMDFDLSYVPYEGKVYLNVTKQWPDAHGDLERRRIVESAFTPGSHLISLPPSPLTNDNRFSISCDLVQRKSK